jgi:hypothetical protein
LLSDQKEKKKGEIFINVKRKRMLSARFRIKKMRKKETRDSAYLFAIIILKIYKFIPKLSPR